MLGAVGNTRAKGYLPRRIVIGTIGIEGGYYNSGLGLGSRLGLLATAGNPK